MKVKRILSIVIVLLLVLFISLNCYDSSISPDITLKIKNSIQNENITLTFGTNKTDIANSVLADLFKKYSKLHPNVTIQIEAYKDPDTELKIKAAAGELPDIGIVPDDANSRMFSFYYEPLNDLGFSENNLYGYAYGLGADGRLYALNSGVSYTGIVYNKKCFKTAGISKIPDTIQELYEACAKLKAKGIVPFASNFKDKWTLSVYSNNCILAVANTGNSNYRNDLVNHELFIDDGGLKASFDFLRNMNSMGYLEANLMTTSWENMKQQQADGMIAMTYLGSWLPSQLNEKGATESDIGIFPFPGSKVLPQSPDWLFAVSKNSKHIKEAKKFLKWLWEDGRYAKVCGMNPPLKSDKVDDAYTKEILSYNLPIADMQPNTDEFNRIYSASQIDLQQALQEYITSQNPQSVLDKYSAKWKNARK